MLAWISLSVGSSVEHDNDTRYHVLVQRVEQLQERIELQSNTLRSEHLSLQAWKANMVSTIHNMSDTFHLSEVETDGKWSRLIQGEVDARMHTLSDLFVSIRREVVALEETLYARLQDTEHRLSEQERRLHNLEEVVTGTEHRLSEQDRRLYNLEEVVSRIGVVDGP